MILDFINKLGADVSAKDRQGRTALHLASEVPKSSLIPDLLRITRQFSQGSTGIGKTDDDQIKTLKVLIKAGAHVYQLHQTLGYYSR
jgi:ankyrin repeat protein